MCSAQGTFDPCVCEPPSTTTSTSTTGAGGSTGGDATTGPLVECLPVDELCEARTLNSNDDAVDMAACSVIGGSLQLIGGISDVTPLTCLTRITGQLYVETPALADISGMSALERIDGELEIGNSSSLSSISLPSLQRVGYFSVYDNTSLEALDLPMLTQVSQGLEVSNNPNLPTCEVQALVTQLDPAPPTVCYTDNFFNGCPAQCTF